MTIHEQDIIALFKSMRQPRRDDVVVGIGDDAAVLTPPANQHLLTSTDTLVAGVHFPENLPAKDIAYRAVMVNLSDLAACGATPYWLQLALTLPKAEQIWLNEFTQAFAQVLQHTGVQCVGGDISRGHLSLTIQVMGFAPANNVLRRDGAHVGDDIYVAGELGLAALGLQCLLGEMTLSDPQAQAKAIDCWLTPIAQNEFAQQSRQYITSAIDLSDGLVTDLKHICQASRVNALCTLDAIPMHSLVKQFATEQQARQLALAGGEDYLLCFTAKPEHASALQAIAQACACSLYRFGHIVEGKGELMILDQQQQPIMLPTQGYQHF